METSMIDNFRVVSKIADTRWGNVYHVKPLLLDKSYALKITEAHPERIHAERQILEKLGSHPNIVELFFYGECNGNPYLVEELFPCDLNTVLKKKEDLLSWTEAVEVVRQILAALQHAHATGVIHQDLKPSNVLIRRDPNTRKLTVKLCDFNLSREHQEVQDSLEDVREVAGSIDYLSPEQRLGSGSVIDSRTDLFNVGLILYELITGTKPGIAAQPASKLYTQLRPFESAQKPLPAWVDAFIAKALEPDRVMRFQTSQEMLDAIQAGLAPARVKLREKVGQVASKIASLAASAVKMILFLPVAVALLPFVVAGVVCSQLEKRRWIYSDTGMILFVAFSVVGSIGYYWYGAVGLCDFNFRQALINNPASGTIVYRTYESVSNQGYMLVDASKLPEIRSRFIVAPEGREIFALSRDGKKFVYLTDSAIMDVDLATGRSSALARSEIFKFFTGLAFDLEQEVIFARLNDEIWTIDPQGKLSALGFSGRSPTFNFLQESHPYELDVTPANELEVQFKSLMPGNLNLGRCRAEKNPVCVWFPTQIK